MPPSPILSPFPWVDLVIIVVLLAMNGLFAMSELAVVSSRRARLRAMEKNGNAGAAAALRLAEDPGRFLSAIQIGITLIGVVTGAYSGASLGGPVGERIALLGVDPQTAASVGFALVIAIVTYLSLIIGELVPKQIALRAPEKIAVIVSRPMSWLASATLPLVWLLDRTTGLVFALLRMKRTGDDQVTAEDLHMAVAEATSAGVLEENERAIITGVVRLADRPTREVMTPRTDVDWIDADADAEAVRDFLLRTPHSRIPVAEGSVDRLIGVVATRDIAAALADGRPASPRALMKEVPVIHDRMDAMDALSTLQASDVPMLFVHDEYGHFDGMVTPADLLTALAGAFASDADLETDPPLVERDDGSWWVSGSISADALADRLGIALPAARDYATAAGFALSVLKRIPNVGETFRFGGWQFEIVDMDGRKIDKLLASRVKGRRRASA